MVARNRSAGVVGVKIGVVWMISILIASPLVFVAVFRPGELMEPRVKHCAIMNAHFLVYGSLTAFFVPLVIMLVTYSLSMRLLTKQALVLSNGQCPLRRMKRGATSPDARIDTQGELFPDDSGLVMGVIARDISREERDEELTQALDCSASPHTESCCGINGGFVSKERPRTNAETMLDFDGLPAATSTSSRCGFPMRASRYLPINTSDTSLVVPQNGKPSSFLRLPATIGRKDVEEVGGVFDCENVFSERQHSSHSRMFHGAHDPKRTTPSETAIEALTLHDEPHSAISGGTANEEGMLCFRRFRNRLFERTSEARTRRLQKLPQQPESYLTDDSIMKTPGDKPRSTSSEEPRPGTEPPSINASNRRFRSLVQKHSATLRVAGILIAKRERQTRAALHSVRNERKAIRVLGVMFAIFFVCWAPFFCVNLTMGVCDGCHHTGSLLFRAFLWLGYVSSTLNPIVYTVFNRSFRQTFLDILLPRRHCCRR